MRTRIIGTGMAVPSKVMTNADIEKLVDTSDQWIVERTGIRERRILEEGRTTSDLAAEAGRNALAAAGIEAHQLDAIICATISPDSPLPATAVIVQQKLGASCPAFDMAAACAGFLYGMTVADGLIRTGSFRRVLVIGVEILSRWLDWTDRNTCVLFGDGAGAAVLAASNEEGRGILSTHIFADGAQAPLLHIPGGGISCPASADSVARRQHFVKMNGRGVFVHAVRNISRASQTAMEANGVGPDDIDWVIAHQANLRIIEGVAEKCKLPLSKFYLNIHKYGNTSSASVPIALDEAVREGKIQPGQLLLFCALGAGFSWGSALVRW
ncbi:MAG TPA: beta-ketoacyl-ACP synthase III [Polyangia bacterium]|nr:beta-ketoacyl-ACP synthase III [Polyangia bacterium]